MAARGLVALPIGWTRCFGIIRIMMLERRMRTTVSLDDDVAASVEQLRGTRGLGLSEAVKELIRAGLRAPRQRPAFRQRTADLGLRVDVSNVAEALDVLDGPAAR